MDSQAHDLQRFVDAQERAFGDVLDELTAGRKQSHWMWFVFPQLAALGRSGTARFYGIVDMEHARAYQAHPVLGPRLVTCAELVLATQGRSAHQIFGSPDDTKLRSCMTLFEAAAPGEAAYARVLDRFYGGVRDPLTQQLRGPA